MGEGDSWMLVDMHKVWIDVVEFGLYGLLARVCGGLPDVPMRK